MDTLKVLVADDEPALRQLLQTNLELEGYETLTAENGQEALEVIRGQGPHVVVLDVMMPVMDGWQVLEELKAGGNPHGTRVILVTAKASDDAQLHGWRLGCDEYIIKPFDLDVLLYRIREVAARSGEENGVRRSEAIMELQAALSS